MHEGRARAYLAAGDDGSARRAYVDARTAIAAIVDPEDRVLIDSQLAELGLGGG